MGDGAPTDSSTLTHILCGNPLSRAICREISDACRHGGCQGGESVARRATGAAPGCGGGGVSETGAAPACGGGGVSETGAAPACGNGGDNETGAAPASRESPDIGVSLEAGVVWVSCCAREGVAGVVWVSRSAREGVAGGGLGFVLRPRRRGGGGLGFAQRPTRRRSAAVCRGTQGELPRPQLLSGVTGRSREGACCIRVDGGDGRETRETRSHVVNPSPRPLGTGKATIRSSHQQM